MAAIFSWSSISSKADIKAHAMASAAHVGEVKSVTLKQDARSRYYVIVTFGSSSDAGAFIVQQFLEPLDGRTPSIQPWTGVNINGQGQSGLVVSAFCFPALFLPNLTHTAVKRTNIANHKHGRYGHECNQASTFDCPDPWHLHTCPGRPNCHCSDSGSYGLHGHSWTGQQCMTAWLSAMHTHARADMHAM